MSTKVKAASLSFPKLQSQISNLQNKNLPFNKQMAFIDVIFKGTVSQRLIDHMKTYKSNWSSIKLKYGEISQEILEKECTEVIAKNIQQIAMVLFKSDKAQLKKEKQQVVTGDIICVLELLQQVQYYVMRVVKQRR